MMDETNNDTGSTTMEAAPAESIDTSPVESASQPSQPSRSWERTMESAADNIDARELPPIAAPSNWKAELADHWGKLPREVQEFWNQREADVQKGFSQFGND